MCVTDFREGGLYPPPPPSLGSPKKAQNDPTDNFSEKPVFSSKSLCEPPLSHPNLEGFLSQVENELFEITKEPTRCSKLSLEEWRIIRTLPDNMSIVIRKADKGSCVLV